MQLRKAIILAVVFWLWVNLIPGTPIAPIPEDNGILTDYAVKILKEAK